MRAVFVPPHPLLSGSQVTARRARTEEKKKNNKLLYYYTAAKRRMAFASYYQRVVQSYDRRFHPKGLVDHAANEQVWGKASCARILITDYRL